MTAHGKLWHAWFFARFQLYDYLGYILLGRIEWVFHGFNSGEEFSVRTKLSTPLPRIGENVMYEELGDVKLRKVLEIDHSIRDGYPSVLIRLEDLDEQ